MAILNKQRYSSVTFSASSLDAGRCCFMPTQFTPGDRIRDMQWTEGLGTRRAGLDVVAEKTISTFTRKQTPSHRAYKSSFYSLSFCDIKYQCTH
jgi:hypothetical protein